MSPRPPIALMFFLAWATTAPCVHANDDEADSPSGSRIVHHFHFDERAEGNLEELPRYWAPLRLAGFPRFAAGAIDFDVGNTTPVSFHLASNGRNVAFQYTGPETRVREATDYRIVAYLRPDRLDSARACLSAYYLDRARRPLLASMVRSRWIGEASERADWVRVELFLPPAPAEAHTIGLSAWVMQESAWNPRLSTQRHLSIVNVNAGVWVDDIIVYALPFVSLATTTPSNVLGTGDAPELHVVLADQHDQGLMGDLRINDASGMRVESREIPATAESPAPAVIVKLDDYAPGMYEATLHVRARDRVIVTRTLRFAKLAPALRFVDGGARAFGIAIDPAQRSAPDVEDRLIRRCGVQSLKLPVWSGLPDEPALAEAKAAQDRWLQVLLKDGFVLTGVFAGVSADLLRSDSPYSRSLLDLLSEQPTLWESSLGAVVAPYASTFRAWQVGPDDWHAPLGTDKLSKAVDQLATAMRKFVTAPYLIAPVSTDYEAISPQSSFAQLSIRLPAESQPQFVAQDLAAWRGAFSGKLSFSLAPLPPGRYERSARLADWAQRLIAARHAGVETVFVPQPWTVRSSVHGPITEPLEEYIVLRTLADMIGEARPTQHVMLTSTAQAFVFDAGSDAVVAAWDSGAPPGGTLHAIQFGSTARQVDIWGVSRPLQRDARGRQVIRLGPMPTLMDRADAWLIELYSSFKLNPPFFESGRETNHVTLEMENQSARALSGELVLRAPRDWDVAPRQFDVNLMPGRGQKLLMDIRVAHNAPAGDSVIMAELTLSDGLFMEVPLAVRFGLSDADVKGMAWLDGNDLMIRHEVTSRAAATLHFRGSALVPGRERQYRPITNLQPAESQRVEYKFRDCAGLVGSSIRLELRETNDGPRTHTLELQIP